MTEFRQRSAHLSGLQIENLMTPIMLQTFSKILFILSKFETLSKNQRNRIIVGNIRRKSVIDEHLDGILFVPARAISKSGELFA